MSELDEGLRQLLSDDEGLKSLLSAASGILGKPTASSNTETPPPTAPASAFSSPDLLSMLGGFLGGGASASGGAGGQSNLASAIPGLLQSVSGKASYIKEEKLNLVKAMKPYMAEGRAGSIDRAIKMANMAKAAKTALGFMGR